MWYDDSGDILKIVVNMTLEEYLNEIDYVYLGENSLSEAGFIHASTLDQFFDVSKRFSDDKLKRLILIIETEKLEPVVKFEAAKNGLLYPHIYGRINIESIIEVMNYTKDESGIFMPSDDYLKHLEKNK